MFPIYIKRAKKEFYAIFMKIVNLYMVFTNKIVKLNEKKYILC